MTATFHARNDMTTAGVVGLGGTGLPLALELAVAGTLTTGLDVDRTKIAALRLGESYLPHVSADALEATADWFEPTSDPSRLAGLDTYVICVPVPWGQDGAADLGPVLDAVDVIGPMLRPGSTVEVRSTVPPGAIALLAARLAEHSGLRPGIDFRVSGA
jgi:UDP-N-acetyl-D-glucosamine dehydrogenase